MDKTSDKEFKCEVARAWEGIATDCGSEDGEGAADHLEQVFFHLAEQGDLDPETRRLVGTFDPRLKKLALEELKRYG